MGGGEGFTIARPSRAGQAQPTSPDPRAHLPTWDYLVVTAADERQAALYERELAERRRRGDLSWAKTARVLPDLPGAPIGTGGATLQAICWIARDLRRSLGRGSRVRTVRELFVGQRLMVVHAGGEGKRIPLHTPLGKSFAPLPVRASPGRPSDVIGELLARLAALRNAFADGLLVASGDVLLLFDPDEVDLRAKGVLGLAFLTPWRTGRHHGVYIPDADGKRASAFLQKPPLRAARTSGAITEDNQVWIDTGVLKFDSDCVARLAGLAGLTVRGGKLVQGKSATNGAFIDLYDDVLSGMLAGSAHEPSWSPAEVGDEEQRQTVRREIQRAFASVPFRLCCPGDARFLHLGTTQQYWRTLTDWTRITGTRASRQEGSYVECPAVGVKAVVLDSVVRGNSGSIGGRAVVQNCLLNGPFSIAGRSVVRNVTDLRGQLAVRPGVVVDQVVVGRLPVRREQRGRWFVTRVYGLRDNPKLPDSKALFLGQPLLEWLEARGIGEPDVWPHVADGDRTLWNARLFPAASAPDDLSPALWMQESEPPPASLLAGWRAAPRLSFEDTLQLADGAFMRRRHERLRLQALALRAAAKLMAEESVSNILAEIQTETEREAVLKELARLHGAEADGLLRARILKAMADTVERRPADPRGGDRCVAIARRVLTPPAKGDVSTDVRDRLAVSAFREVAEAMSHCHPPTAAPARFVLPVGRWVTTGMAARIDFGGGWSDTPPHSLEQGGCVLNAAIKLNGEYPIRASARVIPEPVIRLRSVDQRTAATIAAKPEALAYAAPGDPMAIPKAAICCLNILPPEARGSLAQIMRAAGGGIEIVTESRVPQGCGLGASSIVAAAITSSLLRLTGKRPSIRQLVTHVSIIEQMLTTGGGWQDQIGALVPGIKLATTRPGLEQMPSVRRLRLDPATSEALRARLVLVYTGRRRLAKDILQSIMGRYLSRDREVTAILAEIQHIAREMMRSLSAEDLEAFGLHMGRHWQLNKILDPKTSNRYIETLMNAVAPYAGGAKLAGAGGGGFMIAVARSAPSADDLRHALRPHLEAAGGYLCDYELADPGMKVVVHEPEGT